MYVQYLLSTVKQKKKKKKTWKMLSGSNLTPWKWCLLYLLMFSLVKQLTWQPPTSRVAGVMVRPKFKKEEKYRHKITADGDCSYEIEWRLLLGRKVMTNLDSILKSRDITLPTKDHLVKAMVFPVVIYGCESWTIKKAECWGPAWGTLPVAKVMRKEARHTQRRDRASGVPLEILEHLPP